MVIWAHCTGGKDELPSAHVTINFENTMVEVIKDSYDYDFISIFSEIGGSIGVLIGMSCMTIVEFGLMLHEKIHSLLCKKN